MSETNLHPVLRELLNAAASEMDDLALQCSDASEHLENGQMLAALGALSGWEDRMRHFVVVIQGRRHGMRKSDTKKRHKHIHKGGTM